jgi:phosphomevalonate kinase
VSALILHTPYSCRACIVETFHAALQSMLTVTPTCSAAHETHHPNPFVETTLSYVLSYVSTHSDTHIVPPCAITILADDSYYTSPASTTSPTEFDGEHFKHFGVTLWDAHKTGLGSSAALVTALTAALLTHYLPSDLVALDSKSSKARLHNLAQAAHCAAQGKVGSGFDVASAVYGSCLYRRFSPSLLDGLGSVDTPDFATRLRELVDDDSEKPKWDTEIIKEGIALPRGLRLVMADVDCGSKTPGMVKDVQTWKKTEPEEAGMIWTRLHHCNLQLANALQQFAVSESAPEGRYEKLRRSIREIRDLVQTMTRLSGVPIEPPTQTALLDALSTVPGVVGGVVPGAGGFDAVALLVEDSETVITALKKGLDTWNKDVVKVAAKTSAVEGLPSDAQQHAPAMVSLLKVREDDAGIRVEDPTNFLQWIVRREASTAE